MDDDGSKLVDYREFSHGCGLEDNLWSRRMFNLLDKNFTGKTCRRDKVGSVLSCSVTAVDALEIEL